MAEVYFKPRYAILHVHNPELAWLQNVICESSKQGLEFGEATIEYHETDKSRSLILISDRELGYYLLYQPKIDTWLSLGDRTRLSEVICPDDWQASVGLFVSRDKAWLVIYEFCQSGERSSRIEWIRPTEIPEGGNW